MENQITRTVYGSRLQSMQYAGLPFSVEQNTTLNEKFNIVPGVLPPVGVYPHGRYYCIGNGGHRAATSSGIPLTTTIQHQATDAALFNHLPFALRALNNDLSQNDRQKYALRKIVSYGGIQYIAYYLKRIDVSAAQVNTLIQTTNNDTVTTANFVPQASNLNPTPTILDPDAVNLLSGQRALVSANLPMTLTAQEVNEIVNAATIIYGNPDYAIISELGLVHACDYPITLPSSASFNEVICAQIGAFASDIKMLRYAQQGVDSSIDLGTSEPLMIMEA